VADLLQVKRLNVFGDAHQKLLDDVSFNVKAGEMVGVLGPNGAGKTTLMRCLFGALTAFSGEIYLNGRDNRTLTARQRALLIAAVTQETPADFQLSVRSVILTGRTPHQHWLSGKDPKGASVFEAAVRQFNLGDFLDRDIKELSGGERKRVMICRALVQQPQLMILDEPCNHLDIAHQLSLMGLLRKLPVSSLISLHDLPLAARYCDRVLMLQHGRLIAEGSAEEVLTSSLFASVFGVHANTYTNPWEQWSFHATSLSSFSETSNNEKSHAQSNVKLSNLSSQSGAA
jgi:iron complex transport system ATP-binding protein